MQAIPPRTLFKYFSPTAIEKAIEGNYLKWELPCDENDPFEAVPSGYSPEDVARYFKENGIPELTRFDLSFLDSKKDWKKFHRDISHLVAFISFTEKSDNLLMWTHYAKNHTGACVEFDTQILSNHIDCFEKVTYPNDEEDERPKAPLGDDRDKQEDIRKLLSHKAKEWAYEQEWRLIVPPMAKSIHPEKSGNRYILVSDIPENAVKKIIFGYSMPVSKRLVLAHLVADHHPGCKFAEIKQDKTRFKLKVEPLDLSVVLAEDSQPKSTK